MGGGRERRKEREEEKEGEERREREWGDFLMDPCYYYAILGLLYVADGLVTYPGLVTGLVFIFQVMGEVASSMNVRGSDSYSNQASRCSAGFTFFGNLMAVVFSAGGLLGIFLSMFYHYHGLGILGRLLPAVIFLLTIYRVRRQVREDRDRREQQLREHFLPGPLIHSLSLDRNGSPNHIQRREAAKAQAVVSNNPPSWNENSIGQTNLRQVSDGPIKPEKSVAENLKQHFYGEKKQTGNPFEGPQFPAVSTPSPTDFCGVCKGSLVRSQKQILQMQTCGHWYHADCLTRYVSPTGECPLCVAAFKAHDASFKPGGQFYPGPAHTNYPYKGPQTN